jgi:hypothetical protein
MAFKVLAGILAAALLIVYLAPIVLKLRDPALTIVAVVGIALMLIDLWQSLQSKGD